MFGSAPIPTAATGSSADDKVPPLTGRDYFFRDSGCFVATTSRRRSEATWV